MTSIHMEKILLMQFIVFHTTLIKYYISMRVKCRNVGHLYRSRVSGQYHVGLCVGLWQNYVGLFEKQGKGMILIDKNEINNKLSAIKTAIMNQSTVYYENRGYMPKACILRYVNREWIYSVELKDKVANNSLIFVEMENIKYERKGL